MAKLVKVLFWSLVGVALLVWIVGPPSPGLHSDAANAKLDAEIAHALKTTGTYIPKNAIKVDPFSIDNLRIEEFEWRKDGFGTVMVTSFVVHNAMPITVKDITVRCRAYGESGTELTRASRTVYKLFKPGKTKVKDLNVGFIDGQARGARCEVAAMQMAGK
jgi:hypothetical protein